MSLVPECALAQHMSRKWKPTSTESSSTLQIVKKLTLVNSLLDQAGRGRTPFGPLGINKLTPQPQQSRGLQFVSTSTNTTGLQVAVIMHGQRFTELSSLTKLSIEWYNSLSIPCKSFYDGHVKLDSTGCIDLCTNTNAQNSDQWKLAHSVRITASNCYSLFTYNKNVNPNWDSKVEKFISSRFTGIKATKFGTLNEKMVETCIK